MEEEIFCTNCGSKVKEDTNFCSECGHKVERPEKVEMEMTLCANCNAETTTEFEFCSECGKSIYEKEEENAIIILEEENPVVILEEEPDTSLEESPNKRPNKPLYIGIGVAAVVFIALISFISVGGKTKGGSNIIYAKDKELHYTYLSKIEPFEMTERLVQDDSDDNFNYYDGFLMSELVLVSDDGRYAFYPDKIDENGATYYWRDLKSGKSKEETAVKIDIDISDEPFMTSDGSKLFYLKDDDNRLYVYDRKSGEKSKLDDEVSSYYVNENGDYIIYSKYMDGEYSIYEMTIKELTGEKERIDSNANIHTAFPDDKKIYYKKDDALYLKEFAKDKVKITSDIAQVVSIVDGDSVYYLKTEEVSKKLSEFINDDMIESDKILEEPTVGEVAPEPEQPSEYDYRTEMWQSSPWGDEYNSAIQEYGYWYEETDYDAYYHAYEKYEEEYRKWEAKYNEVMNKYEEEYDIYQGKENRDELRAALDDEENAITYDKYLLYHWNNGEEKLVASDFAQTLASSSKKPLVVYQKYKESTGGSKKLSEMIEEYEYGGYFDEYDIMREIEENAMELRSKSDEINVLSRDVESVISPDSSSGWLIADNGTIYFLDNYNDEKDYGTLMSVAIENGTAKKPVKIDDDVMFYLEGNNNGNLYYFKDIKNGSGDLYLEGKKIATDVYVRTLYNYEGTDTLLYHTDYREQYNNGTLCMLKGNKEVKVADDVTFYSPIDETNLTYLTHYNQDRGKGDLMLYTGGDKAALVDDDVNTVLWSLRMVWIEYYDRIRVY